MVGNARIIKEFCCRKTKKIFETKSMKHTQLKKKFEEKFVLTESGWEDSENLMFLNGEPLGMTIRNNGKEIDRWWPFLKDELWSFIHSALEEQRKEIEREIMRDMEIEFNKVPVKYLMLKPIGKIYNKVLRNLYGKNSSNVFDLLNKQTK